MKEFFLFSFIFSMHMFTRDTRHLEVFPLVFERLHIAFFSFMGVMKVIHKICSEPSPSIHPSIYPSFLSSFTSMDSQHLTGKAY